MQYQTPLNVCKYMASLIPEGTKTVLEPTPGEGNLLSVLDGYKVTAAEDFFLLEPDIWDCIIMNPPFSEKSAIMENAPVDLKITGMKVGYYILDRCMEMSENIIALMPWFILLDSDIRAKKLINYGLKSITALPRKTFQYARIQTCVLELKKDYQGQINYKYFGFEKHQQLRLAI